jgi:hypothetical protein
MGGGSWTTSAFVNYMDSTGKKTKLNSKGYASSDDVLKGCVQDFYKSVDLAEELNPYKVCRECRDSEEHPNTIPVIFALDVTGSMGESAKVCAGKLDEIMGELYEEVTDVEFMMMGIGDLVYDQAPIQASQFESDIRILDQTGKIFFEGGGGPNAWESYTAAWYFALHNTDLDCWKRGKKGIIITLGDEMLNPNLSRTKLNKALGYLEQSDVDTMDLYEETSKKFDIYHIGITDSSSRNYDQYNGTKGEDIRNSWKDVIGQGYVEGKCNDLPVLIRQIVKSSTSGVGIKAEAGSGLIKW